MERQRDNHTSHQRRLVALVNYLLSESDALASLLNSRGTQNKENNSSPNKTANVFGKA
ncbi:hypothetical protein [Nostoc sp. PA-18-2419]|uniref:hypothetical protein n=1 Tax=Nostoc sp. PA-18-2419 TaxID=2575443 RepID=UPI00167AFE98|nr:hypothetical protein [Nostoc sp. PA-18-2419]